MSLVEVIVALVIAFGIAGIIVPVLPGGNLLILAAVVGWAIWLGEPTGWWIAGIVAVLAVGGMVTKYAVPGKRLKDAGVPTSTQVVGALFAFVGFFVIPVVGVFVGFPLGVFLAEWRRLRGPGRAWASTWHACKAVMLMIGIDLLAAVLAAVAYGVGLVIT